MAVFEVIVLRFCFVVAIYSIVFSESARLNYKLSSRSSISSVDMQLRGNSGPPLEGCQAVCCCFIDAGILKQGMCECADSVASCETRIRPSFHERPSREFRKRHWLVADAARWWTEELGFMKGYMAVEKEFCMAAPVYGPQIDSFEREFECTCSTSMGARFEMLCGSGCDVKNCERWNIDKLDWAPFIEGRGKCCLSSFTSATTGCEQEVEPLTEAAAKTVLTDAVNHASLGEKKAFVVTTDLVNDMTKSFKTAKEKKLSTSRSGAEFFFSGDFAYILKSIHRPEYEVLHQIQFGGRAKGSLLYHLDWNREQNSIMSKVHNCLYVHVETRWRKAHNDASRLAARLNSHGRFNGAWRFDHQSSAITGIPTFVHMLPTYQAVWCVAASQYRIQERHRRPGRDGCADLEKDALYNWLVAQNKKMDRVDKDKQEEVLEVYFEFIKAFEDAPASGRQPKYLDCECQSKWWPGSLINDFVIAFEYKHSTWMVIKNSVVAVRRELEDNGFTGFHKEHDMFDVKPFPIHSDERELLFRMHFAKAKMRKWTNWMSVRKNLFNDVEFMNNALGNPMVDYSLLVSVFYIDDQRIVLDHVKLPNCIEQRLLFISTEKSPHHSDYGDAPGSILVCFNVIDMLMEFTFSKTPENLLLFKKWSDWGNKIMTMFDCLGDHLEDSCSNYRKLHSKFKGVDIPKMMSATNPQAFVQDVTDMMDANGEMVVLRSSERRLNEERQTGLAPALYDFEKETTDGQSTYIYKCCCHSGEGVCRMVDRSEKWGWSLLGGSAGGCGSLLGKDWHSYWRYAGHCRLPRKEAKEVRLLPVVMNRTVGAKVG